MTIRSDLTVNWEASPRIITIAAPSTEITIQDLLDTCRDLESQPSAMDDDHLIDGSGKEFLGGTTYVGLTVTLNNTVLAFEARGGPAWILCVIAGGNLVSVDENGNNIDPRTPTAYTTVDRTASSSATLQEQEALQYSSFQNAVWIDINGSNTGTDYPVGTREYPVNNITDAVAIANGRGFDTLEILSDMVIDSGTDIIGFTLKGKHECATSIYIADAVSCENIAIQYVTVSGILDGRTHISECEIGNLDYVNGHIHASSLVGIISLDGNTDAQIISCFSGIAGTGTPTIDLGGGGQSMGVRNYNGGLRLTNKTGDDNVSIDLNSGHIILDSTVVSGTIVVRGVGHITDNSGPNVNLMADSLLNPSNIGDAVWAEDITSSTTSGTAGEALNDTVNNARLIPAVL